VATGDGSLSWQGMIVWLWTRQGALSLAKVGQKIVNKEWDSWWFKETDQIGIKADLEKIVSLKFLTIFSSISFHVF